MARRKKNIEYHNVRIEDIGAEGKAIARVNNLIVFTKMAVPGDLVDLRIIRKRKNYLEAVVTSFHEYSSIRTEPFCAHFGICGGCKWQMLPYEKQLHYKQNQIKDQLQRISKVDLPEISPIIGSERETFYRNKLEYSFSARRWLTDEEISGIETIENHNSLGFHVPKMFDKVIQIEKCWLQPEPSNEIRNFIYKYAIENGLTFFNIREQHGLLRTLIIRTNEQGEAMVIISFFYDSPKEIDALLRAVKENFPRIVSLMYVINSKGNDTISDRELSLYDGTDHLIEKLDNIKFKIGPKSFFQTNTMQAERLYRIVHQFAELKGDEVVYDLYTGTGTIAIFLASSAKQVVGIEYIPEAIEDAKVNAELNNLNNTKFYAGDIKDVLNDSFLESEGLPDVIITDPPRAGMHSDVIKTILNVNPPKIVYVSCNPATQARDIQLLSSGYKVTKIQPVDMFPHTHHIENVVLLEKKAASN